MESCHMNYLIMELLAKEILGRHMQLFDAWILLWEAENHYTTNFNLDSEYTFSFITIDKSKYLLLYYLLLLLMISPWWKHFSYYTLMGIDGVSPKLLSRCAAPCNFNPTLPFILCQPRWLHHHRDACERHTPCLHGFTLYGVYISVS